MSSTFPKWYDFFMGPLERGKFKRVRRDLLKSATGKVLEIGSGTGVNFPLYRNADHVIAIEPSQNMIDQSQSKRQLAVVPIEMVNASAEKLPFEDHTFDTVVATLVFCTIPNVDEAINELKRVCKPNGKILLFEHVKMENTVLSSMQEGLTPLWKKICDGCCLNRETLQAFTSQGLKIERVEKFYKDLFIVAELRNR
ncbi:class I SAM-dependent methyltransferase [Neobacillus sp. 179-C4.2 HS]|uniref:Class I SAM-dependent methyltransferase n=1 Tax=Neobacillus driksii TaxID=3035913 RepID=A0ABV4YQN8_9BACI|nr:class I SAM-dependent methyltransferase [Neobacillus sp. 179.-C4.2 HS]MDP5197044.1 class I SAM-dependent methyltransferase [Neobacillus sp. 179.-C4.2 HS]